MYYFDDEAYQWYLSHFFLRRNWHKKENLLCDRLYAPDKDFIELLEKNNKSIYALESKRKPLEFDMVGFSLQYEMCYTTILKLLELSKIPVFSSFYGYCFIKYFIFH